MKMSKVAKMVGVDRRTIYNWITHADLQHLFSVEARREGNRELDEQDTMNINTINYIRENQTREWKEIARLIEGGFTITGMSVAATEVDTGKTSLELFTKMIALRQEKDELVKRLDSAQKQILDADDRRKNEVEEVRKQAAEEKERLLREIAQLRYEMGKLEARLERDNHS